MRVTHTQQAEVAQALQTGLGALARPEQAPKTSFAAKLANTAAGTPGSNTSPERAERKDGTQRAERKDRKDDGVARINRKDDGGNTPQTARKAGMLRPGEQCVPVEGHPAYVEITSGPRNGMFINMTHNERRGEAFVLVKRGDHNLHIYGTGKDRRVIISWHKDHPGHQDAVKGGDAAKTDGAAKADGAKNGDAGAQDGASTGGAAAPA